MKPSNGVFYMGFSLNLFFCILSFGKQPLWYDGRRGSECLILEHSEMIVVSFSDHFIV